MMTLHGREGRERQSPGDRSRGYLREAHLVQAACGPWRIRLTSARQVAELASSLGLDAKLKLKRTLPIVPLLLSCEGAFDLGSRMNMATVWRALQDLVTRA
jgi:hypothetical protein